MHVEDQPTESGVKAILMALPRPQQHVVMVPDVPNSNGRIYPRAIVEHACAQVQERIKNRLLFILSEGEGGGLEMCNYIGLVKHAELDEQGALAVEVETLRYKELLPCMDFVTCGTGKVEQQRIVDYTLEAIIAVSRASNQAAVVKA